MILWTGNEDHDLNAYECDKSPFLLYEMNI